MSLNETIARNLSDWMENSKTLTTIKKVAARSGVGFGTVQRVKNGDGNPTAKNLDDIARAFGKRLEDIIRDNVVTLEAREPAPAPYGGLLLELVERAQRLNDQGMAALIERAEALYERYPRPKANHAN